jgi:transposase
MASKAKKKYSDEFKGQAVRLSRELGHAKAAQQLGVSEASLSYWKKTNQGKEKLSEAEQAKADREELQRLRKENAEQKQVILILKKAAAFFSNDQLK